MKQELQFELERMEETVEEIEDLRRDLEEGTPELRDQAAPAKFMGDVYLPDSLLRAPKNLLQPSLQTLIEAI